MGDSIPDLNYTVTGWKHSDASLPIGTNPATLASLELWLDASDTSTITHTTNAVSQWSDKSGNGEHVVQSTAANKPSTGTSMLAGKNVVSFYGDDYLQNTTVSVPNRIWSSWSPTLPTPGQAACLCLMERAPAKPFISTQLTNGRSSLGQNPWLEPLIQPPSLHRPVQWQFFGSLAGWYIHYFHQCRNCISDRYFSWGSRCRGLAHHRRHRRSHGRLQPIKCGPPIDRRLPRPQVGLIRILAQQPLA